MVDIYDHLSSMHPLPAELVHSLRSVTREQSFGRKEHLVRAGKLSLNVYFIQSGLVRCSYSKGGKDISSAFIPDGQLCFPVEHFFRQRYGMENIQALETTRVQSLPFERWQQAYRDHPVFRSLGIIVMEKIISDHYLRWQAMWMQQARERYQWYRENLTDLSQRVPGRYLASYLGFSAVMLSRLRSER